jgi:cytochrome c oxidase cbb3-type subunit IV
MDVNDLRIVITVAAFFLFVAVLVWTYLPARKEQFDDAAQLPFRSE